MTGATMMLVAMLIDSLIGWPRWLYIAIGHPVSWIGELIDALDRWLNLDETQENARRKAGIIAALVVIGVAFQVAVVVTFFLPEGWLGVLIGGVVAWPLIAVRQLHDHVRAVARPLEAGELEEARETVSMIVGRDPSRLGEAGVARAALESLAENTSDGITAPVFWGAIFGLPGLAVYKAINTLDSMIGHRTPRYEAFGCAAARIDDVANFLPARLTGLCYVLVSGRRTAAMQAMRRDAAMHRSPNAGWPESALAGALDIRLSGPRIYGDKIVDEPWLNRDAQDPVAADIRRGLALYRKVILLLAGILLLLALPSLI